MNKSEMDDFMKYNSVNKQSCQSAFLWQWDGHWVTKFVHGKPSLNLAMVVGKDQSEINVNVESRNLPSWMKGWSGGWPKIKALQTFILETAHSQQKHCSPKRSQFNKSQELWSKGTTEGTWSAQENCQNKLKPAINVHFKKRIWVKKQWP